jgi:hypothetical protein
LHNHNPKNNAVSASIGFRLPAMSRQTSTRCMLQVLFTQHVVAKTKTVAKQSWLAVTEQSGN